MEIATSLSALAMTLLFMFTTLNYIVPKKIAIYLQFPKGFPIFVIDKMNYYA